jgi:hypothetical protein
MNILLTHPIHGSKIATMEIEAEEDVKNGWVRYTTDTPEDAEPVNALKRRRKTSE